MSLEVLAATARLARQNAYCPYSHYAVGAAVEAADGEIFGGCNVENLSYGLTICAERAALAQMVSHGQRQIVRVYVTTEDGGTPCGMCVQSLLEFATEPSLVEVIVENAAHVTQRFTLSELMPHAFKSERVGKR